MLQEIQHLLVEIEEELPDGYGGTHIVPRKIVQPPERVLPYLEIASDLLREKEARGCLIRDLSVGELACLIGVSEGFNRATNAKYDEPKKEAND